MVLYCEKVLLPNWVSWWLLGGSLYCEFFSVFFFIMFFSQNLFSPFFQICSQIVLFFIFSLFPHVIVTTNQYYFRLSLKNTSTYFSIYDLKNRCTDIFKKHIFNFEFLLFIFYLIFPLFSQENTGYQSFSLRKSILSKHRYIIVIFFAYFIFMIKYKK